MKKDKKKTGAELDLNQGILIKPAAQKNTTNTTTTAGQKEST